MYVLLKGVVSYNSIRKTLNSCYLNKDATKLMNAVKGMKIPKKIFQTSDGCTLTSRQRDPNVTFSAAEPA